MKDMTFRIYYIDDENMEEKLVTSLKVDNYAEMVRCMTILKDKQIPFYINDFDDEIKKDLKDKVDGCIIDDINVVFGGSKCLFIVDVYIH